MLPAAVSSTLTLSQHVSNSNTGATGLSQATKTLSYSKVSISLPAQATKPLL